jgi:hypothetical protein
MDAMWDNLAKDVVYLHRISLGFRRTENIIRTLELELWFYGRILGFPVEGIEGVEISNMPEQ